MTKVLALPGGHRRVSHRLGPSLLDENLDWRLRRDLPGHAVGSVPLIGWAGLENGALLAEAQRI